MDTQNTQISITFELLERILAAGLSIATTRILICMIYVQDREALWSTDDRFMQNPEEAKMWAFGTELRSLVGPTGSNNARSLKNLVSEVGNRGLFDELFLTDRNSRIHWQFNRSVHELMALRWLGQNFALLDLEKVRACGSMTTLDLYCRVRNLRNHPIPEFEMPLEARWCDHRKKFLLGLQKIVAMENTTAFVGLEWIRRGNNRRRILVRLRNETTTWYPNKLRYWSFNARVFRVSDSEITEIDSRDLRRYVIPGEMPDQVETNLKRNLAS